MFRHSCVILRELVVSTLPSLMQLLILQYKISHVFYAVEISMFKIFKLLKLSYNILHDTLCQPRGARSTTLPSYASMSVQLLVIQFKISHVFYAVEISMIRIFKADSHIACRAHAVPLPCRAAKGLECAFPI